MTRHDADLMYSAFREIDTDDSGSISRREFYSWSGLEQSPFTEAVFKVLDADESGEVDFKEFSLVLWNYLSFSLDTLAVFAFGLADVDDLGFLENREVLDLRGVAHLGLDEEEGEVTKADFVAMAKQQPMLLFPAYKAQELLRKRVVGENFWWYVSQQRQRSFRGSADIWSILDKDNPWENFGEQKYVPGVAHVPAKLQKYVGKHFTRENYSDYKSAEHEASIMMREQLAKERKQGLKSVEAHHEAERLKEMMSTGHHNDHAFTSQELRENLQHANPILYANKEEPNHPDRHKSGG
eukprot:FR735751.1.p1 GENE.FR735751.1~~FR735751.1.p1  ORF type:complete len:315 (+),score=48.60 FR735751.1:60-947(+)